MPSKDLVVLTGGTGTVKLINGLYRLIPEKVSIITNTGDDFIFYGLKVCPDTDSVLYSLGNLLNESNMWGLKDDTFEIGKILKKLDIKENKVADWFNLGDKDLAYCLFRTHLMNNGKTFTEATKLVQESIGINKNLEILPMSDNPVTTFFTTTDGKVYHFEEFFIRLKSEKPIEKIDYVNAEVAGTSDQIIERIHNAKIILIGPSNPITSIGPILAIKEIKKAIKESNAKKVVISPIIGREAYSGPAKTYMEAKGIEVSPIGIFDFYKDLADEFYFATTDQDLFEKELTAKAQEFNKKVIFDDIIFHSAEKQLSFAEKFVSTYGL